MYLGGEEVVEENTAWKIFFQLNYDLNGDRLVVIIKSMNMQNGFRIY